MRKPSTLILGLALAVTLAAQWNAAAQSAEESSTATSKQGVAAAGTQKSPPQRTAPKAQPAEVRAGTRLFAELESTLDAHTAKPGDQVVARVTKNVKQDGRVVVRKGDHLLGRVQSVSSDASAQGGSSLSLSFDRIVHGETTSQISAVMTAVLATPAEQQTAEPMTPPMDEPGVPVAAPTSVPAQGGTRSAAGGGLVGGVASTAGATAGAVTSTVGTTADSTVRGTAQASGATLGHVGTTAESATHGSLAGGSALATPRRAIRVESGAHGEQQTTTNSMLSTRQGNLRLDSGTRLEFRVAAEQQSSKPQGR